MHSLTDKRKRLSRTLDQSSFYPFNIDALNIDRLQSVAQAFQFVTSFFCKWSSMMKLRPTARLCSSLSFTDLRGELLKTTKSSRAPNRKTLICFHMTVLLGKKRRWVTEHSQATCCCCNVTLAYEKIERRRDFLDTSGFLWFPSISTEA